MQHSYNCTLTLFFVFCFPLPFTPGSEWTNLSIAAVVFSSLGVSVPLFAALGICLKGALCIPGLIRDVWSTRLDTKG